MNGLNINQYQSIAWLSKVALTFSVLLLMPLIYVLMHNLAVSFLIIANRLVHSEYLNIYIPILHQDMTKNYVILMYVVTSFLISLFVLLYLFITKKRYVTKLFMITIGMFSTLAAYYITKIIAFSVDPEVSVRLHYFYYTTYDLFWDIWFIASLPILLICRYFLFVAGILAHRPT